eukprot:12935938-Prorocentrum_lima.AAC.1
MSRSFPNLTPQDKHSSTAEVQSRHAGSAAAEVLQQRPVACKLPEGWYDIDVDDTLEKLLRE